MCTCAELGKIWPEEKCLELIRKFKANSVLWDTKNSMFYKQDCKRRIWDNIGKELETTGKHCKHKMGILLSSFRREKAKFINGRKTGTHYRSFWFGFKELSFLIDRRSPNAQNIQTENSDSESSNTQWEPHAGTTNTKKPRPGSTETVTGPEDFVGKIEPLDQGEEEYDEDEEGNYVTDILHLAMPENHSVESRSSVPNVMNSIKYEHNFSQTTKPFTSTDDSDRMDEIIAFNNFIQAKMKKYSAKTLSAAQRAICDVIFKADQNYYENDYTADAFVASSGTSNSAKALPLKRKRLVSEVAEPNQENENSNEALRKL